MIFDYIWFIEKFRPVAFLIENVAGIMECDNDGRIKKALDDLASDGYTITEPRVLNAANYGVPQNRMRWIVAGTRKNTNIILPEPTATVTPCGSVFLRSTENAKNHVTRKHTAESICRYMKLPYGGRDKLGRVDRLDPRLPSKTVIAGGTKAAGALTCIRLYHGRYRYANVQDCKLSLTIIFLPGQMHDNLPK